MIVQSFGTSWKMEDSDKAYLSAMKQEIGYAHSRGIECERSQRALNASESCECITCCVALTIGAAQGWWLRPH